MPVADYPARPKYRGRGLDLDQDDHGGRCCNGRGCVHDDAQRAVVGVALNGMYVRHLDDGQQREQHKTHYGHDRPGTCPGGKLSAEFCTKSCQETILYLKNTHNWMRRECSGLRLNPEFKEAGRANAD